MSPRRSAPNPSADANTASPANPPALLSATTLTQFSQRITEFGDGVEPRWFRGVEDAAYQLRPSLYRRDPACEFSELIKIEAGMTRTFRDRALPFISPLPTDDLELLFLMQHYGFPTRLLDWTANPFVALFFSLKNWYNKQSNMKDAAVWMLLPEKLNKFSTAHMSPRDILPLDDSVIDGYKPKRQNDLYPKHPVAISGVHNSQRIVSQRGVFVIFGACTDPLEIITGQSQQDFLQKIIIPRDNVPGMSNELFSLGITDSVIYPDLEGLAREIKRQFGFPGG